jgi:DNA-binding NtrC family response regulator
MAGLFEELARAAPEQAPVLLLGETGSGKELVARALHASSPRAAGPFLALNCAAIPPDLLEADVFGVARGAATGVVARQGIFQRAEGGTLLLDEIGDLPSPLQAKLLRALEERQVTPVGGMPQATDVRVVAATHRDLDAEIAAGRFRPDLYYRLAAFVLRVPPLRDRREDMPALVAELVSRFARASGRRIGGVSARALAALEAYSWPGNVRELEHETRRWVASCPDGGVVDSSMLDPRILATAAAPASPAAASPEARFDLEAHLARAERELIVRALAEAKGNRTRAAAWLGISRNGLAAKIARHGLEEPSGGD